MFLDIKDIKNTRNMHSVGDANLRRRTTSSVWINIGNGKGTSSWVQRQSKNRQASGPCAPDPWPFKPKNQ